MGKYTVYLPENLDEELLERSRRSGRTPSDTLKRLVLENFSESYWSRMEEKLDAVLNILSLTAEENSFTGGATRAAVKNNESVTREGLLFESNMRRTILSIRASLAPKRSDL